MEMRRSCVMNAPRCALVPGTGLAIAMLPRPGVEHSDREQERARWNLPRIRGALTPDAPSAARCSPTCA